MSIRAIGFVAALAAAAGVAVSAAALPLPRLAAPGAGVVKAAMPIPRPNPAVQPDAPFPLRKPLATADTPDGPQPSPWIAASWRPPTVAMGDRDALRAVLETIAGRQGQRAIALRDELEDPIDRKIADWHLALSGDPAVSSAFITRFATAAPDWPSQDLLRTRAEQALEREDPPAAEVLTAFEGLTPRTVSGTLVLARAHLASGDEVKAQALASRLWRSERLSPVLEKKVLKELGALISPADHKARADMFLYAERTRDALRSASRISADERKLVDARVAVIRRARNAGALLKAVPASQHADAGYIFARIQHLRRAEKHEEAIALMVEAPSDPAEVIDGDEWWIERKLNARKALDLGMADEAYRIAAAHAAESPASRAEAEFHAGWFALRFLHDPVRAKKHFATLEEIGTTPITRSRALYWLGRCEEAAGNHEAAAEHYGGAARYRTAFYGQLAREKLGDSRLGLPAPPTPSPADIAAFRRNELVIAIRRLEAAGFEDRLVPFYRALGETLTSPGELALVHRLAHHSGRRQLALMVAKLALARNVEVDHLAFPTEAIPEDVKVEPTVGKPLVYAIARQESAFNPGAVSSAGARGLLQLMPATARATARRVGLTYSPDRLTTDPSYNATLGAAHLDELLERFNGSYILTFAAYNAGPSRSYQWMERYGDPRRSEVDAIDWIERIPFTETRNYVQRIMENLVVYRARFERDTLQVMRDLKRG